MCRIMLIIATIASLINCYAASTATLKPDAIFDTSRILSILDYEDYNDTDHAAEPVHTKDLEQLGSIAYAFRHQFRDVIEEVIVHAFTYLRSILHDLKVRLFKKLGKYTLTDLFHVIFDGVANLVEPTDLVLSVDEEHPRPSYGYNHYPYVPHPYSKQSDLNR